MPVQLGRLYALTEGDAEQARVRALISAVRARLDELRAVVDLARQGKRDAAVGAMVRDVDADMTHTRTLVDEIQESKRTRLATTLARRGAFLALARDLIALAMLARLMLVGALALALNRQGVRQSTAAPGAAEERPRP